MTKGYMVFVEGENRHQTLPNYSNACILANLEAKKYPNRVVTVLEIKQQMIGRVQVEEI